MQKNRRLLRLWRSHERHRIAPRLLGQERDVYSKSEKSQGLRHLLWSSFILQGPFAIDGSVEALGYHDHRLSGSEQASPQNKSASMKFYRFASSLFYRPIAGIYDLLDVELFRVPGRNPRIGFMHAFPP